jgi:hypothetical protein
MTVKQIDRYAAVVAVSAMLFFAVHCGNLNPANTSEVGNPKLSGHLIDGRTKTPADSAMVRLYPVYLNKMAKALGKVASTAPAIDSTLTDRNGYYRFGSLQNSIYSVEAELIDGADTLSMRHPYVLFIGDMDLGWDTLRLPGSIKGKIVVPSGESAKGITCYLPGTSYIAITNDTGGFRITGIPAGTYSLSITSTRFNDTTLYGIQVNPNRETDKGNITLSLDRSKNEHNVWGIFDTTSDYKKVHRIEARLSGDSLPADSPRIYSLDWRPDVAGYSGFIYLPSGGLFWKVAVWVYDAFDHRIGAYEIPINRSTGDIQFPSFDPCNGIPAVALQDTTVSIYDSVPLHPAITRLADDSIVSMAWDIGNTGTFTPTAATDTLIIAPNDSAEIPCVFRVTDRFGNVAVRTGLVTVVTDPPTANAGNDTTVNTNDSFSVHYSGTDGYGRIVKYRFDANNDGVFEDSSTISGDKRFKAPSTGGNFPIILQVEDDDGNRSDDTMIMHIVFHGMVAYWPFDSTSDSTFYDMTGHGYDAHATGTGYGLVPGVVGQALNCSGSDTNFEITVANSTNDFYLQKFAVECWFYSNVNPSQNVHEGKILDYQYITWGIRNGYTVDIRPSGAVFFGLSNADGSNWVSVATPSATIQATTWYHLVCTYDSAYLRIYVNGVLSGSVAYQGSYLAPNNNAHIGYQERTTGENYYHLNGRIDELKLFNYALPPDSIINHYYATRP